MDLSFIFKIAAVGILTALLSQLLARTGREEQAFLTTIAGVIVVLAMILTSAEGLLDKIRSLLGM